MTPAKDISTNSDSTKERLIGAAIELIADRGFDAVSIRDITSAASANLAAIGYHFGSKDDLLETVFERLAQPVNSARADALATYRTARGGRPLELEGVIRTLIEPFVRFTWGDIHGSRIARIIQIAFALGRPEHVRMIQAQFDEIAQLFIDAIAEAVPSASRAQCALWYSCAIASLLNIVSDVTRTHRIQRLAGDGFRLDQADEVIEELVAFFVRAMNVDPSRNHER